MDDDVVVSTAGLLPVVLRRDDLSMAMAETLDVSLSPDEGLFAIRRRKGTLTVRDISSGKDVDGVCLHRIKQSEWAQLGSEHADGGNLTASMALIGGSSAATHPAALVAVDEARSLVLLSIEGDTPTAYRTDEPGQNRVLADLHVLGKGKGRKAYQSEVPAGRFKQLLKKNGHDLPLKSICIAGCATNGVMLAVDGACLVGLCFTSDLRRVYITVIQPFIVRPKWLPVAAAMLQDEGAPGAAGAVYKYSSVLRQALRLDPSGLVTVYSVETGECTAMVDLSAYASIQESSEQQGQQQQRTFVSLEIGPDGLWLAAADEQHNVVVASLNTYFEAYPSHRADFWSAAIVLGTDGGGGATKAGSGGTAGSDALADSDSESEESESEESDGEDADEEGGGGGGGSIASGAGTTASDLSGSSEMKDAMENDSTWMNELVGYAYLLDHQAKDTRTDSIERQWFEPEDQARNTSDSSSSSSSSSKINGAAQGGRRKGGGGESAARVAPPSSSSSSPRRHRQLRSTPSSSSLLPAVALSSNLSGDSEPTAEPTSTRHGLVYLKNVPGSAIQGMVVTAISVLRFFRSESDSTVGDLEVYHLQTNERRSHRLSEAAAIVKCQHDLPALHLTETSVMAFVMQTTRRELVDELIMFEHTVLAEHLCSLNGWDRHTLNSHQLETGLKYRQLEVVDKVLASLDPDQLVTAYGMVVETVEAATRLSKGVDFAQRLLQLTTHHLNAVVESAFEEGSSAAQYLPDLIAYLCRLRANLIHPRVRTITAEATSVLGVVKYIPSDVGGEAEDPEGYDIEADIPALQARHAEEVLTSESTLYPAEVHKDFSRWRSLSDDEVLQYALQTDTVLNAQIYLALKAKAEPARRLGSDLLDEDYFGGSAASSGDGGTGTGNTGGSASGTGAASLGSSGDGAGPDVGGNVSSNVNGAGSSGAGGDGDGAATLWTHTRFRATALGSVFDAVCRGEISDAVTILTSLGEDVQAHLRWIYGRTSRSDIRKVLLDAEGDPAGLHDHGSAISRAVAFMDQITELYPSEDVAGSVKLRKEHSEELKDMTDFPYQQLVPLSAGELWTAIPGAKSVMPPANGIMDATAAPEPFVDADNATPPPKPSKWYAQLLVDWIKDWDEVTRDRVLLEAVNGDASSLRVSDLGRLHYSLSHGDIDEILEVLPDVLLSSGTVSSSSSSSDGTGDGNGGGGESKTCRLAFINILMRWKKLTDSISGLPETAKADWRPLARAGTLFTEGAPSIEQHVAFLQYAAEGGLTGPALRYTLAHNLQDLITKTTSGTSGTADAPTATAAPTQSPWLTALGELLSAADAGADVAISHAYARLILETPPSTPVTVQLMVEKKRAVAALATLLFVEAEEGDNAGSSHVSAEGSDVVGGVEGIDGNKLSPDQLRTIVGIYPLLAAQLNVPTEASKAAYERVTVYDLLSACPKLGFGPGATAAIAWQTKGPRAEMPHFSGDMTELHGAKETLNYQYYLGQGRPFHAFQLYQASVSDGSSPTQPHMLAVEVQDLAMAQFRNSRVASACLLFLELVHEDGAALVLRDEITAASRVFAYRCRMYGSNVSALLDAAARDVATPFVANHHGHAADSRSSCGKMLADLQKATDWQYGASANGERKVPLHVASQEWQLINRVFKHFGRTPPRLFLKHCAEAGSWLEFLAFSQVEGIDSLQVDRLAGGFKDIAIRQHIRSAVRRVQRDNVHQRGGGGGGGGIQDGGADGSMGSQPFRDRKTTIDRRAGFLLSMGVNGAGMPVPSGPPATATELPSTVNWRGAGDLFDMLFLCNSADADPAFVMLGLAMAHKLPFLAVFASSIRGKPLLCICTWLYATHPEVVEDLVPVASQWSPGDPLPWRNWSWSDLLGIILVLCANSLVSAVREAMSVIKIPGSPLIHVVEFCELFSQHDYDGCASRLRRYMSALSDAGVAVDDDWEIVGNEEGPPRARASALRARASGLSSERTAASGSSSGSILDWSRNAADTIIAEMLQRSTTPYERKHLLRLLFEASFSKTYNKLYQTFIILSDVGDEITMDIEPEAIVEALASRKLFDEAYAFAKAHGIASHLVTLRSVESRLDEFQRSCLWESEKARLGVWTQFQQVFEARVDSPGTAEVAGTFFVAQAQAGADADADVDANADGGDPGGDVRPAAAASAGAGVALTLRERIILLSTGVDWLRTGAGPRSFETKLKQYEREMWMLRIQFECQADVAAGSVPGGTGGRSVLLCGLGDAAAANDGNVTQEALGSVQSIDAEVADWEATFAGCTEVPDVAGDAEHRALDALIGHLLTSDKIVEAQELAALFKYKSADVMLAVTARQVAYSTIDPAAVQSMIEGDTTAMDVPQVLQALADRCVGGRKCCRRVLSNYMAATMLNMSYQGMLAEDPLKVLRYLVLRGRDHFDLAMRFIRQNRLASADVCTLLSALFLQQIANDESEKTKVGMEELERRGAWICWSTSDFAAFVNVSEDPAQIGRNLLAHVEDDKPNAAAGGSGGTRTGGRAVSAAGAGAAGSMVEVRGLEGELPRDLSVSVEVELLCRAHNCFVLVGSMDVISAVLNVARERALVYVEQEKFNPLVKLLCSIKRFREMEYILDIMMLHGKFELLLGKDVMADDLEGRDELKMALRDYLIRRHPEDAETLQMVSLHFQMYREIGENRLYSANLQIKMLGKRPPGTGRVKDLLFIIQMLSEAASHLLEQGCLRRARWCFTRARLVGLQVQMVDKALLNLTGKSVAQFIAGHPNFRESLIVAEAYDKRGPGEWVMPLFQQVVLGGNIDYLDELHQAIILPASTYTEVKSLWMQSELEERQDTASNFREFLETCRDKAEALKIATEVGLTRYAAELVSNYPLLGDEQQ